MSTSHSDEPTALVLVPARAGSVGVPRKNIREFGGRPLFAHTVSAARDAGLPGSVVVSSDDAAIEDWCRLHGVTFLPRAADVAGPSATIADVVLSVLANLEWTPTHVVVLQPTSPMRSAEDIRNAWDALISGDYDSLMSAVPFPHLMWQRHQDGSVTPLFEERVNRQEMKSVPMLETGAIQISTVDSFRRAGTLVGPRHCVYELSGDSSIDIDTKADLLAARAAYGRGLVVFRLTANRTVGSGHLFHSLLIAEYLDYHEVHFLLKDCDSFVSDAVVAAGYRCSTESDLESDLESLKPDRFECRVLVNDVLDTQFSDLAAERSLGFRVMCIEDLGAGPLLADVVVNALYPAQAQTGVVVHSGPAWTPLRSEFLDLPEKAYRSTGSKVLLSFGGTDPNRLTTRFANLLVQIEGIEVHALVGPGAEPMDLPQEVVRHSGKTSVARLMHESDLVLTSAGRTVYEVAATGTPVVVIAQNAREATHAHVNLENGVIFEGLAPLVSDSQVESTVRGLLADVRTREDLGRRLHESIDRRGAERIAFEVERLLRGL